jgi:cytochrome b involved in lipid metabolism
MIAMENERKFCSEKDCWVAINGVVYDFTEFVDEHPPGAESITKLAGTDGTKEFINVHNFKMLEDFEDDVVGLFENLS